MGETASKRLKDMKFWVCAILLLNVVLAPVLLVNSQSVGGRISGGGGTTTGPTGTPTATDILTSDGTANHVQDPGGCQMTSLGMTCASGMKVSLGGNSTTSSIGWTSETFYSAGTRDLRLQMSAVDKFQFLNGPMNIDLTTGVYGFGVAGADTGMSRISAKVVGFGSGTAGDLTGTVQAGAYATGTNCSSAAAPATCGSASSGSFVIAAAGTSVTVNTTAVTANSQIYVQEDESLGTKLGVTCNTGILANPPAITARTAATSFAVGITAGLAVNPVCFSYSIIN